MLHSAARPFEAPLTDVTELFSLVANLVLLASLPVYSALIHDTAPGRVRGVTRFLEWLALLLIVAVCVVAMYAQLHIFKVVDDAKGDERLGESHSSYKRRMLRQRIQLIQAEE